MPATRKRFPERAAAASCLTASGVRCAIDVEVACKRWKLSVRGAGELPVALGGVGDGGGAVVDGWAVLAGVMEKRCFRPVACMLLCACGTGVNHTLPLCRGMNGKIMKIGTRRGDRKRHLPQTIWCKLCSGRGAVWHRRLRAQGHQHGCKCSSKHLGSGRLHERKRFYVPKKSWYCHPPCCSSCVNLS